jgi:alpha-beta hydrolase superfamily lysophospholipase
MYEALFDGSEGKIFYHRWDPVDPPTRIVQIVHGYAEHGGRYAHVAAALATRGAVVYADDHIGHGRSDGERALITNFDHVVDDLHTLSHIAKSDHPGLPLVLVGHSMGGLLSGRFAQRWPDEVAGVAFCGSVIGDWRWAREALALPELPPYEFNPLDWSRDPAAGASYAADPLVYHGQYKRGLIEAEVEALDQFAANIDKLTMPVAVFHGTADPFVPYQRSVQAVNDMPTDDVTIHLYEDGRHEVLNDSNRDEVISDLSAWIDTVA